MIDTHEFDIRAQFADVDCSRCGRPASEHGLHGATWHRGDSCVWMWIGVIKNTLGERLARPT
jgi:hypothetical protein